MRTYILAIATAALFAIPTAAFSEEIGIGPGGVRIGLTTAITASTTTKADAALNCGKLAFIRKSWASKEWATVRDIAKCAASSGGQLRNPERHSSGFFYLANTLAPHRRASGSAASSPIHSR